MMNKQLVCMTLAAGLIFTAGFAYGDVVGYFKFDEFTGTSFMDDSGNGLRGFLGESFTGASSIPGPSGAADDYAVAFDGQGGLIIDDEANQVLNITEAPITLECWIRSESEQGGHVGFISYGIPGGRTGGGGYKLGMSDGNLLFTTFAVRDFFGTVPVPRDGEWHHIAAVYGEEIGGAAYYVDGEEWEVIDETGSYSFTDPGAHELNIGTQFTAIGRFDGDMDRVRISNAILSPDELDSDRENPNPVVDSTVAYFGFDSESGPYTSEGAEPAVTTVPLDEWVVENPPQESTGAPGIVDDSPSGAAGDTALEFSGAQLAIVNDPEGIMNFSDGDWTLEAWVQTAFETPEERMMVFYYGHAGHGYSLSLVVETWGLQVTTLGIADMPSEGEGENYAWVNINEWNHVAVVHRAGESVTYYINGEERSQRDYTSLTNPAESTVLYIGAEWNGGLPFTGLIDRVRISNEALDPADFDDDAAPVSVSQWSIF